MLRVSDLAQEQELKPGAWRLKRKNKNEESKQTNERNTPARPLRVSSGSSRAAGDRRFVLVGTGPPAVVTTLWIQLPGMVGQMVAVESGAIHESPGIVG